jgi:hypothetical protein
MINIEQRGLMHPLGDRIDTLLYAHFISILRNEEVNIKTNNFSEFKTLKSIMGASRVFININVKGSDTIILNGYEADKIKPVYKQFKDYPKCEKIESFPISLPKKFVTVQWDAKQNYRKIKPDRKEIIEQFYKDQGYDLVTVGGEASNKTLREDLKATAFVMSRADYHVGADSGLMNFSKLIIPTENIHVYTNTNKNRNPKDLRFPSPTGEYDGMVLSPQCKEIINKGAKFNFSEQLELPKEITEWYR